MTTEQDKFTTEKEVQSLTFVINELQQVLAYAQQRLNKVEQERSYQLTPNVSTFLCPVCQSSMVLRKSRPGQKQTKFAGCSEYPKCKGSRNLSGVDTTAR